MLNHWTKHLPAEEAIRSVNRKVKDWSAYFHFGNSTKAFQRMHRWYICGKVRRWLWRKHRCKGSQRELFPDELLYQQYKLWKLPAWAKYKHA